MKIRLIYLLTYCCLQTFAQYVEQGNKLTSGLGSSNFGSSLSMSGDAKTIVVGSERDSLGLGAAWVYVDNGKGYVRYGDKLVGSGWERESGQGSSVSISEDGKTIIVGGALDNLNIGGAWVYTFNGSRFVQLGTKLTVTDAAPNSGIGLGNSVSISADGKTALVGGYRDNDFIGATWVFTFNGTYFVQFGPKLIGSEPVKLMRGSSVSLSADGKTALIGCSSNGNQGGAWIFTFDGNNFIQFGDKLWGTGFTGRAEDVRQGWSVSLSADGKTAILGGIGDNSYIGASWIFTFNGSNYVQLGDKLVGTGTSDDSQQGVSVSISANGKTAVVGGENDNNQQGTFWIFTFNGSNFVQLGNKQKGSGAMDPAKQGRGSSVYISKDAKIILSGGTTDNSGKGAVWVFIKCIYSNPPPNFSFDVWKDTLYLNSTSKGDIFTHQWVVSGQHLDFAQSMRYHLTKADLKRDSLDISLIVTDLNGCKDSVNRTVRIPHVLYVAPSQNQDGFLKINPNPFNSFLNIQTIIPGSFILYNSIGQIIFKKSMLGTENIELSTLPQGAYYYQYATDRFLKRGKLIKEE